MMYTYSVYQDVVNGENVYPIEVAYGFTTEAEARKFMNDNGFTDDTHFILYHE